MKEDRSLSSIEKEVGFERYFSVLKDEYKKVQGKGNIKSHALPKLLHDPSATISNVNILSNSPSRRQLNDQFEPVIPTLERQGAQMNLHAYRLDPIQHQEKRKKKRKSLQVSPSFIIAQGERNYLAELEKEVMSSLDKHIMQARSESKAAVLKQQITYGFKDSHRSKSLHNMYTK